MNMKERVETLRSLKTEFLAKQAQLAKVKSIYEQGNVTNLARLLESDLEQAKLILAAKDVCDRLQKIAEHLAELGAEEIMPLADAMKGAFGPDAASNFEHAANSNIQNALETVRAAKDSINDAILQVEGKIAPQTDMSQNNTGSAAPNDMATYGDNSSTPPATDDQNQTPADDFGGADAAAGPDNEPLGRSKKESFRAIGSVLREKGRYGEGKTFKRNDDADYDIDVKDLRKKAKVKQDEKKRTRSDVEESIDLVRSGKKLLENISLDQLIGWILSEASKTLKGDKFLRFTQNISTKAIKIPEATAGWIGMKRWGRSAMLRLIESEQGNDRTLKIAKGIAKVIETNISIFGKGKAAQVVESFTNDLLESDGLDVSEAFNQHYGCSPAMYSLRLGKQMREDDTQPMDPQDKDKIATAVSQLAAKVVTNPGVANQPAVSAISNMDQTSQTALQKIAGDTSSGTIQNVGQLVKAADDKIDPDKQTGVGEASGRQGKVMAEIRAMGLLVKKDEVGDYVVNYKGFKPGEGYFTDDLEDALSTAKEMARKMPNVSEAKRLPKTNGVVTKNNTAKQMTTDKTKASNNRKVAGTKQLAYEDEIEGIISKKKIVNV